MLPIYFDYIFVHQRQKVRLKPELSPKFLSTLGLNPTRKARLDLQLWYLLIRSLYSTAATIICLRYTVTTSEKEIKQIKITIFYCVML